MNTHNLTATSLVLLLAIAQITSTTTHFLQTPERPITAFPLNNPKLCSLQEFYSLIPNTQKYAYETHKFVTDDGYELIIFRVRLTEAEYQKLPADKQANRNRPVLAQHGISQSGDDWFKNGENNSIGYFMVQQGFDVWSSNIRGSKYCKTHIPAMKSQMDFYNNSFEDYGLKDLPAMYKKVLSFYPNPNQKIIYMAHSQGTSMGFAALLDKSTQDFFVKHTEHYFAFAPIVFMTKGVLRQVTWYIGVVEEYTKIMKVFWWGNTCCNGDSCGGSIKSIAHYAQETNGKGEGVTGVPVFQKFDYGKKVNLEIYGQEDPTEWDVTGFPDVKLSIQANGKDVLATPDNVKIQREKLTGKSYSFDEVPDWGHNSLFEDVDKTVIKDLIKRELNLS